MKATSTATVSCSDDGVRFVLQDALTKTVPVWAAVLNRAVAQLRSYHDSSKLFRDSAFFLSPESKQLDSALNLRGASPGTIMAAKASHRQQATAAKVTSTEQDWDTSLHLPPWVSSNERLQIEAKLDQWVRDLCQVICLWLAVAYILHSQTLLYRQTLPKSTQPTPYLQLCTRQSHICDTLRPASSSFTVQPC